MSNNQNRGTKDYTKYNAMPTEQLEEILRLDAEAPADQALDGELVLYVMEVLAQRKQESEHTGRTAREAYESFKSNYMPETDNSQIPPQAPAKHRSGCPCWIRRLTAVAAVLVVLFVGSVTANAFGFNVWKAVIQWTQETFHFGDWGNSNANNSLPYASLQEALEKSNTPAWLAPTRIPDGFEMTEIKVEQTPLKKVYRAQYANGEKSFLIAVQDYLDTSPVYVEQNEGLVEEYEVSGIIYYMFTDVDLVKAKWITDSCECSISGNVTIEELKMMIDSIEKG